MFFLLLYINALCLLCSGYEDSSLRSSYMYGSKPILRVPNKSEEQQKDSDPKRPEWVNALRNSIQASINLKGYDKAQNDIKKLIASADRHNKIKEAGGELDVLPKSVSILRTLVSKFPEATAVKEKSKEPRWEKDLKLYIKTLISEHGKANAEKRIMPVVKVVEANNNVEVLDIDVNPYGHVTLKWKPVKNRDPTRVRKNKSHKRHKKSKAIKRHKKSKSTKRRRRPSSSVDKPSER